MYQKVYRLEVITDSTTSKQTTAQSGLETSLEVITDSTTSKQTL